MPCDGIDDVMTEALANHIRENYPKVEIAGLTVNRRDSSALPACTQVSVTMPMRIRFAVDTVVKLDAYNGDHFVGRSTRLYYFSGSAKGIALTHAMSRGDVIDESDMDAVLIPLDQVNTATISHIDPGMFQLRSNGLKGRVLDDWSIEPRFDVAKGQSVRVIVHKQPVTLTVKGSVLDNGRIGRTIRVALNDKILVGTLHDKNTVYIDHL